MKEYNIDIAIIGGGTGGVAAALAALRAGCRVALSEETDWIGGQFTSQAVPPDEHPWIEQFGCTATYRKLRDGIREYYRNWYPLTPGQSERRNFNPGGGNISRICHEPKIALAVMEAMLAPYLSSRQLLLFLEHKPVNVEITHDRISSVMLNDLTDNAKVLLHAPYFLDATELGDLLHLGRVEHVMGAESQDQTGEPHAPTGKPQPLNQQSFAMCFAMSHHPGENHVIDRPRDYSFWRNYKPEFWPDKLLSWWYPKPSTLKPHPLSLFKDESGAYPLWEYRKIQEPSHFLPRRFNRDCAGDGITLVNWPQMDYWLGPLTGVSEEEARQHVERSKQLSLSLLYWMQVEAPRPDGGTGYPGLQLRTDILGTRDGLAKYPYVRESRRIQAEFTVLEQHVSSETREGGAEKFSDSVGIGSYHIDLHPSSGGDNYIDFGSWPFQIPLGSLIPVRVENLLPACKNLGVTHITNGCYRLHPVEWNIGESAGALAAYCLREKVTPRQVHHQQDQLENFQKVLLAMGVELDWPKITSR
jgi:hypothetical protein